MVHKLKTWLTVLGIFFGIVAVVGTFTVNGNVTRMVSEELAKAGSFTLTVRNTSAGLSAVEKNEIERFSPAVARAVEVSQGNYLQLIGPSGVSFNDVIGVGQGYFEIKNLQLREGRIFRLTEDRQAVIVLGAKVAQELFGHLNPLGRIVALKSNKERVLFRIVGVLAPQGVSRFLTSSGVPDESVYVPVTTLRSKVTAKAQSVVLVQSWNDADLALAKEQISGLLRQRHGANLEILDPKDEIAQNRKIVDGIVYSGLAIGLLCLLSGGIGIMNVMLVSIAQRRREIGLYKALGFPEQVIRLQFVAEALAISVMGSILGVVVGVPIGSILSWVVLSGHTAVNFGAVMAAVSFSLFIGCIFGYWPAQKAARMDPVEALRG